MDVAIHLGAHCTDGERLLRSLLRNRDTLATYGVAVPGPGRYRDVLRQVMHKLRGEPASADTRDVVLESVLERDEPERLVLSNPNFLSSPAMCVEGDQLYPKIHKARWLRNIFPESPVAFYLGVRNPATFVPALHAAIADEVPHFDDFIAPLGPAALRWSDTVERLRDTCPDCPVTVWCHEDAPLIWGEAMHTLAGLDMAVGLHGGFDMLRPLMTDEGLRRLRAYTKANPPANELIRRRIVGAFLDKFGLAAALEQELDLPGWSADLIARMTVDYEADVERIAALPGVSLIRC